MKTIVLQPKDRYGNYGNVEVFKTNESIKEGDVIKVDNSFSNANKDINYFVEHVIDKEYNYYTCGGDLLTELSNIKAIKINNLQFKKIDNDDNTVYGELLITSK